MDVCFRGVFKLLESVLLFTPYRKLCPGYTGEIMEKNGFFNYHESLPFFFLLFLAISAAPLEKKRKEKETKKPLQCRTFRNVIWQFPQIQYTLVLSLLLFTREITSD